MDEVSGNETITARVGQWLIDKKFSLVSCVDKAGCLLESSHYSGLKPSHCFALMYRQLNAKPRRCYFGLIKKEPPKSFLGFLWFNNSLLGASESNWVLEVFEESNLDIAKQLVKEMVLVFGVKTSLCFVGDRSVFRV
jgi:hypothetical protein